MYCVKCSRRVSDAASFCAYCGAINVVLLFEVSGGANLSGGPELAVKRHNGGLNVAFADGHVRGLRDFEGFERGPEPTAATGPAERSPPE